MRFARARARTATALRDWANRIEPRPNRRHAPFDPAEAAGEWRRRCDEEERERNAPTTPTNPHA